MFKDLNREKRCQQQRHRSSSPSRCIESRALFSFILKRLSMKDVQKSCKRCTKRCTRKDPAGWQGQKIHNKNRYTDTLLSVRSHRHRRRQLTRHRRRGRRACARARTAIPRRDPSSAPQPMGTINHRARGDQPSPPCPLLHNTRRCRRHR